MKLKKSALKIGMYALLLTLFIVGVKAVFPHRKQADSMTSVLDEASANSSMSCYFIGSSRVMKGIVPAVFQTHLKSDRVYNMGISSATFLNNCMLAEYIIRKKGPKVIFIELSAWKRSIPPTFLGALYDSDFSLVGGEQKILDQVSLADRFYLMTDASNYLFSKVSLNAEFKQMLGSHEAVQDFGYKPSEANKSENLAPFISWQELDSKRGNGNDSGKYLKMVRYLTNLGEENETRVVFFLPLTSKSEEERDAIIPVYHALPDSNKLVYTVSFMEAVYKRDYLMDENHLNRRGAEESCRLLCPQVGTFFNKHD